MAPYGKPGEKISHLALALNIRRMARERARIEADE